MPADQITLNLRDDAIEELMALAQSADDLSRILSVAGQATPKVGTVAVGRLVSEKLGIPLSELRPVIAALVNFYQTQIRLKLDAAETAESITRNLARAAQAQGKKERLKSWEEAKAKIVEAASRLHPDHPLIAAYKAFRVATSREYELVDMRIFTDARPVFDEAGDKITQTIISHVLSLDYHNGHDHRVIQFTLDATDVADLRQLCERAERKAAIIKRDLKDMEWPTTIFREPTTPSSQTK